MGLIYSRKKMIDELNSYLIAYKLHLPQCLYSHKIEYYINKDQEVISLKPHQVEYIKSSNGGFGLALLYKYFNGAISIGMRENRGTSYIHGGRKLSLWIEIEDSTMKDIMTDEFKQNIEKIFGKAVYTSNDFRTYKSMDYKESGIGSRRSVTKAFIKVNKMIEKLAAKNEVV
ncbi:hypothetical protein D3C75_313620 [compost metagenome]